MKPPVEPRDPDGVRIVRRSRGRLVAWVVGLAIAAPVVATLVAVALLRWSSAPPSPAAPAPAIAAEGDAAAGPTAGPRAGVAARPASGPTPGRVAPRRVAAAPVADPVGFGPTATPRPKKSEREIDATDAILMLREEGIHEGIAAFGLPGTDPPKPGILVPEEYEVPEGYVRHYQTTDDGESLPAILMFHPDYEFVDEHGAVVKLPEDGVVPPEMAPPGLDATQVLEVPERKRGEPLR